MLAGPATVPVKAAGTPSAPKVRVGTVNDVVVFSGVAEA